MGTGSLTVIELVNRTRPVGARNIMVEASVEPAVMVNALPPGDPTSGIASCSVPEFAMKFPFVRFRAVSKNVRGAPLIVWPPLTSNVEAKRVEGMEVEPVGGGYIWPLMNATLSILTAERLEVMMGRLPVFVIPALNTTVDAVRNP